MKTKDQVNVNHRSPFYALLYPDLKQVALDCGYSLAIHGSLQSDMDLIAVPWIENAKPRQVLVQAITDCIGKTMWNESNKYEGELRPHGRVSYAIPIAADVFIDLAVMPVNNKL